MGNGYNTESHNAFFSGFLPADDPKVVIVVIIQQPQGEESGGGLVAAPAFAKIAAGAMRVLNVPPDSDKAGINQITLDDKLSSRDKALVWSGR